MTPGLGPGPKRDQRTGRLDTVSTTARRPPRSAQRGAVPRDGHDVGDQVRGRPHGVSHEVGFRVRLVAPDRGGRVAPPAGSPAGGMPLLETGVVLACVPTGAFIETKRPPAVTDMRRHSRRAAGGAMHSRIADWPSSGCRASSAVCSLRPAAGTHRPRRPGPPGPVQRLHQRVAREHRDAHRGTEGHRQRGLAGRLGAGDHDRQHAPIMDRPGPPGAPSATADRGDRAVSDGAACWRSAAPPARCPPR
jgi:hypothetical protein